MMSFVTGGMILGIRSYAKIVFWPSAPRLASAPAGAIVSIVVIVAMWGSGRIRFERGKGSFEMRDDDD